VPEKILVIGTTSDYIDWIQKACPEKALFLTDPKIRKTALENFPSENEELCISLDSFDPVKEALACHLKKWNQTIKGVACFDCESLELASRLASHLGLEYHSLEAIQNCRDKHLSKVLWQQKNIPCPESMPINSETDAVQFLSETPNGIVLKPFYGSGSELVFRCQTPKECKIHFKALKNGLIKRQANPLFKKSSSHDHLMLAEKFIPGPEYSCDFIIENSTIRIVRMTRKIKQADQVFGTVSGYVLVDGLPPRVNLQAFETCLLNGAKALGIQKGICMVDFILEDRHPFLVEITPRPGGDCIPFLLKEAGDIDILALTLDMAAQKPLNLKNAFSYKPLIGIRIHAQKAGKLLGFDTRGLDGEKRIKKIHFIRKPGHIITMPPADYDSWLLGHIIIEPASTIYPETQCLLIKNRLGVQIEE